VRGHAAQDEQIGQDIDHVGGLQLDALANAEYRIVDADSSNPVALIRTVGRDTSELAARHEAEVARVAKLTTIKPPSLIGLDAPDAYEWTLYHLLQNESVIKDMMFPITFHRANGNNWVVEATATPVYSDIGTTGYAGNVDDRTLSRIACVHPTGPSHGEQRLLDMAMVIRSKDAGINRLTFDVIFDSAESYETALPSNVFNPESIAKLLGLPAERVVGTFFVDSCSAIKISIDRPNVSASGDERDVFGAQQQSASERLVIPIYAEPLVKASTV
jgi:Domain of unknown function (DUF4387)